MDDQEEQFDSFEEMDRSFPVHDPDAPDEVNSEDDPLSTAELERLYQEALRTVESVDSFSDQLAESMDPTDPYKNHSSTSTNLESDASRVATVHRPSVRPRQILESVLFVGGTDLTRKRLARLLGETATEDDVEREIEELNAHYASQNRPYEIRFGEGGYRLALKSEFERIRNRVYGFGPKDVKLSQESLEVLALVAYKQPIEKKDVETLRAGSGPALNQLLRRELIALDRVGKTRNDVQYTTTPRFLQLFGLGELDDLPHPDDLSFK